MLKSYGVGGWGGGWPIRMRTSSILLVTPCQHPNPGLVISNNHGYVAMKPVYFDSS